MPPTPLKLTGKLKVLPFDVIVFIPEVAEKVVVNDVEPRVMPVEIVKLP